MVPIMLSIGAVYAFIPVLIIIILILAARGSAGTGFFDIFGITTLVNFAKGIGGSGSGKGIANVRYKPGKAEEIRRAQALSKRAAGVGEATVANLASGKGPSRPGGVVPFTNKPTKRLRLREGGLWQENYGKEVWLLRQMSTPQIRALLNRWEYGSRTSAMSREQLIAFAAYNLSFRKVGDYFDRYIRPMPNSQPPLPMAAPGGRVKLSVAGRFKAGKEWMKVNRQARRAKLVSDFNERKRNKNNIFKMSAQENMPTAPRNSAEAQGGTKDLKMNMLEQMSQAEIQDMIRFYGLQDAPQGTSKENMLSYAYGFLTPEQIRSYFEKIKGSS